MILLPQPPLCWDYRHAPCLATTVLIEAFNHSYSRNYWHVRV
jgi:hypothetical protein